MSGGRRQVTSSAKDPDPRGTRLRGWPVWGGHELRGLYCVLPQDKTAGSKEMAEAARGGAHMDPEPVHLVVSGYVDEVPGGLGRIVVSEIEALNLFANLVCSG